MGYARCGECSWEIHGTVPGTALKAWQTHHDRVHSDGAAVTQLPSVDWHSQALHAIRSLAVTGRPFVIADVIELGVGDPANPRTDWPKVTAEAQALGWIEPHGYAQSTRPTAKSSAVRQWIGTYAAKRGAA